MHKMTMMTLKDFLKAVKRNTIHLKTRKKMFNETSSNMFLFTFWGQAQQSEMMTLKDFLKTLNRNSFENKLKHLKE